jgi:hypothetical protein
LLLCRQQAEKGQRHFGSCTLKLSQQEASIAKQPLLKVAERMRNDGSPSGHHCWMRQHSLSLDVGHNEKCSVPFDTEHFFERRADC